MKLFQPTLAAVLLLVFFIEHFLAVAQIHFPAHNIGLDGVGRDLQRRIIGNEKCGILAGLQGADSFIYAQDLRRG